jgi:sugar lactone lactonase YvrE
MKEAGIFFVLCLAGIWLPARGAELTNDADTLFLAHLNGDFTSVQGGHAAYTQGCSFVDGVVSQAVRVSEGGRLAYPATNLLSGSAGTIEMWLRVPDLGGSDKTFTPVMSSNNHLHIARDPAGYLHINLPREDAAYDYTGFYVLGWHAGTWHHLAVTWDSTSSNIYGYADGELQCSADNFIAFPNLTNTLIFGNMFNDTNTHPRLDMDEIRISDRARDAREIARDYYITSPYKRPVDPWDVAHAPDGSFYVSDCFLDAILVYHPDGSYSDMFGVPGSGNGELSSPRGLDFDSAGKVYIADASNRRVAVFSDAGTFVTNLGAGGTGPGLFQFPVGIAIDSNDCIYVADTENNYVQRFLPDYALDTNFGAGGILGNTNGLVRTNHTGFSAPRDIAVLSASNRLYVADRLNNRVEIYSLEGVYQDSVYPIYHPHDIAAASNSDLYITGGAAGPRTTAGSVRHVPAGAAMATNWYCGGWHDDLHTTRGITLAGNSELVFINIAGAPYMQLLDEMESSRLCRVPYDFDPTIRDVVLTNVTPSSASLRWHTRAACTTILEYGQAGMFTRRVQGTGLTCDHAMTITNIASLTSYVARIIFPDSFTGRERESQQIQWLTEPSILNAMAVLHLNAMGMIYTNGLTTQEVHAARAHYDTLEDFFWRATWCRVWLDFTIEEIGRVYTTNDFESSGLFKSISAQNDLAAQGYSAADDIDMVIIQYGGLTNVPLANLGSYRYLFGKYAGFASLVNRVPWVCVHETHHALQGIFQVNGLDLYPGNYGLHFIDAPAGGPYDANREICRLFTPAELLSAGKKREDGSIMLYTDMDGDRLVDTGAGLPITEETFLSSAALADTDGDGLNDLEEAVAGLFNSTGPQQVDTDADARRCGRDGPDTDPLYPAARFAPRGTVTLDGVCGTNEPWQTALTGFNLVNVDETNGPALSIQCAWDTVNIYWAFSCSADTLELRMDGNADGWMHGWDNALIEVGSSGVTRATINVGDPEVLAAVDGSGNYSELYEDWAQYTNDLGLTPDLVPADVGFASGTINSNTWYAEIAVPFSNMRVTPSEQHALKWCIMQGAVQSATFNRDNLFEIHRFATLLLGPENDPSTDRDSDGMPDFYEWENFGLNPDVNDAMEDLDGDTVANRDEYRSDTWASDAKSLLSITNTVLLPDGLAIFWQGGSAVTQYLERAGTLPCASTNWQAVFTGAPPTPLQAVWTNITGGSNTLFYRIRAEGR